MLFFRFFQGIGTGGEVPVASAYINEFIGAKKRGRFFLLYELIFPIGLLFAGLAGYFLVPLYGWRALFIVGLIPAVVVAHVIGRRGFSKLAAGAHYERVLTAVMLVAVLVGLIGALS